jgi:hypothetical protein
MAAGLFLWPVIHSSQGLGKKIYIIFQQVIVKIKNDKFLLKLLWSVGYNGTKYKGGDNASLFFLLFLSFMEKQKFRGGYELPLSQE